MPSPPTAATARGKDIKPSNSSIVGATLAVVPAPDMHVGVGCRKGSPYAMISRDIVI